MKFYQDISGVEITEISGGDLYFLHEGYYYNIFLAAGRKDYYDVSNPSMLARQEPVSITVVNSYTEFVDLEGPVVFAYNYTTINKRTKDFLLTLGAEVLTPREYNARIEKQDQNYLRASG